MSVAKFDSNAVEMTTVKHHIYLMKFCEELLACQFYCRVLENKIYVWNLHVYLFYNYFDCDVSNLQELEPASLKIKRTGSL